MKQLLTLITFLIATAFNLPGMTTDSTLVETVKRVQESQISNSRDYASERPASLNKKPWASDNIYDMESLAWPDFGGRNYNFTGELNADGSRDYPQGGCAFYQPNITDDCTSPYDVKIGLLRGVVVDYKITRDGTGSVKPGTSRMTFTIVPIPNLNRQGKVLVEAWTKSIEAGKETDGYCKTTVQLLCEEECECTGAEPIIHGDEEIDPGGTAVAYVDSEGLACPPYTWTVSDSRYSISPSQTENDLEEVTITSPAGVCGTDYDVWITVTVTDACGETYEGVVRNTAGKWVVDECILGSCGTIPTYYYEGDPLGRYKYIIGTKIGSKPWMGCTEPNSVTLLASYISWGFDPGLVKCALPPTYYYLQIGSYIVRLFLVTRYEWSCP